MEMLFNVTTPLGKRVRTTERYWHEITTFKHPQLKGRLYEVELTLVDPGVIKRSKSDEHVHLYYRKIGDRVLCVVVKHYDTEGFIITAYFTRKEKEGIPIWQRRK